MVHDTNISQICSPLILVFRLDSQNTVFKSKVCLLFQCLVFRLYQFLFLFLCPRLVSVIHSSTPPPPLFIKAGVELSKFLQKMGAGQVFPIKREGLVKQELSFIFVLTNLFQCYHSPSVWYASVFCLIIYTISISVSREELNLIESNQQIQYIGNIHEFEKIISYAKSTCI